MLSIIFSVGVIYYYRDYIYNKYLDIVDGYIKIKCNYPKCNKTHKFTHQNYLEYINNCKINYVYCDKCIMNV